MNNNFPRGRGRRNNFRNAGRLPRGNNFDPAKRRGFRSQANNNNGEIRCSNENRQNSSNNKESRMPNQITPENPMYQKPPQGMKFNETKELLKNLAQDENCDNICLKLLEPYSRFINFLNCKTLDSETVRLILQVIVKGSQDNTMTSNFRDLLKIMLDSDFCRVKMDKLINIDLMQERDFSLIEVLIEYLTINLDLIPGIAKDQLEPRINNLILIMENVNTNIPQSFLHLSESANHLKILCDSNKKEPDKKKLKFDQNKFNIFDEMEPPENYREMLIFPTSSDLLETRSNKVFIRTNKKVGFYKSVDDYLDVQFRLMREDFIQPLREGLQSYKQNNNNKNFDIRVYKNVFLQYSLPSDRSGILHIMQFDNSKLGHVKWNQTKRFIYGSLLCLSVDNFRTLLFATVADRNVDNLKKGLITIKFHDCESPKKDQKYTMIESTNMFESYRHVLKKLQTIKDDNLPLKQYLVFAESKVNLPLYLRNNMRQQFNFEEFTFYPALAYANWPRSVDLEMDDSQFRAFCNALTKEISIIQGPPGTGKTYIGLKITKCLLENLRPIPNFGPILVVCYTNHALDQFLEGLVSITEKIVRIGSRSKSEKMQNFSLINKKSKLRSSEISRRRNRIYGDLHRKRNIIIEYQVLLKDSHLRLIGLNRIELFLKPEWRDYLKEVGIKRWLQGDDGYPRNEVLEMEMSNMVEWLMYEVFSNQLKDLIEEARLELLSDPQNYEVMDEDHDDAINFLTNQRKLDVDDENVETLAQDFEKALINIQNGEEYDNDDLFRMDSDSDFQLVRSKTTEKLFKHRLKCTDRMSEEEAQNIPDDLRKLDLPNRWKLYRYWRHLFIEVLEEQSKKEEEEFEMIGNQLTELSYEEDRQIMMSQEIIGMTTTGAARYGNVLDRIKCKIIIIEEAAEVLESHVICSLNSGCQHLILIGDHKQLRPSPAVYKLSKDFNLDLSLFERLINNDVPYEALSLQHRMRPEIAELMRHIYDNLQNHESVLTYPNVPSVANNLYFLQHENEENINNEILSYSNEFEAEFIVKFCRHLMKNGVPNDRISILTLYTGQMFVLRKLMSRNVFDGVRICVVDNFQGEENDVIILSLVRSNKENKIGFVGIENRICVCLSRAKHGLFVFGNFSMITAKSDLWKNICMDLRNKKLLGNVLKLECQNHPEKELKPITKPSDFDFYPEGGCDELCNYRLECGHACKKYCHILDQIHKEYKCTESCIRKCQNGHQCTRRCYESCNKCTYMVLKTISECGHQQLIPCFKTPSPSDCLTECERILTKCGHKCIRKCKEKCGVCLTKVPKSCLLCGHIDEYCCHFNDILCKKKCSEVLPCEHKCSGTCGSCYNGRLHKQCNSKCHKILVCNHTCSAQCSIDCPPCQKSCEEGCIHNKCPKKCGDECTPCLENCEWKCKHKRCNKKCYEICDRDVCDEACTKYLTCNKCKTRFQCYGVCGEPCRKICIDCSPQIKEIFFGTEDEENARYITLWTCGHTFEVEGMDKYMKICNEDSEIIAKTCPNCKMIINKRSCFRYANIVKEVSKDIKAIQSKIREKYFLHKVDQFPKTYDVKVNYIDYIFTYFNLSNYFSLFRKREMKSSYRDNLELISLLLVDDIYKLFVIYQKLDLLVHHNMEYIRRTFIFMLKWLNADNRTFDSFEQSQFNNEYNRLKMLLTINKYSDKGHLPKLKEFSDELIYIKKFDDTAYKIFNEEVNMYVEKNNYLPNMEITEQQRTEIVAAIGLGKGRWFKCRNGHFYVIGECGGATEISQCPDCKMQVGGTNHRLLDGNRLAPEIDGAAAPAWPNMDNPLPFDL